MLAKSSGLFYEINYKTLLNFQMADIFKILILKISNRE